MLRFGTAPFNPLLWVLTQECYYGRYSSGEACLQACCKGHALSSGNYSDYDDNDIYLQFHMENAWPIGNNKMIKLYLPTGRLNMIYYVTIKCYYTLLVSKR